MSAIYGVINLNGKKLSDDIGSKMHSGYQNCKIDRHMQKSRENAVFGCELQYFTKEAEREEMPILDEKNEIMFTADCVLDNREELISKLELEDKMIPDGQIMYLGYLKWGKECVKYFRGAFSFVVYEWRTQQVYLYADHFANRCLFYHIRDGILYFSTLLFPMIDASGLKYEENERWLMECLSQRGPAMMFEGRECAFEDVYKVEAANYVTVNKEQKAYYTNYWNPIENYKIDHTITDEDCRSLVKKCMTESVRNCIRTNGEVAVLLSGGLDSTTVGGIAASLLDEQSKKLFSFTSVPLQESNLTSHNYYIFNETKGVLEMCKHYPNIEPQFVDCKGKNILNQAEHILDIWELPCQSHQNAVWGDEISRLASEKGCKIMLDGSTGNTTLSAGRIESYFMNLIKHFKFIKAWKVINHYAKKYHMYRKRFFISISIAELKYIKNKFFMKKSISYEQNITNKAMGKKNNWPKRYHDRTFSVGPTNSLKRMKSELFMPYCLAQIGEIDTKESLAYGILERDPMKNVELIELLSRLPMEFFVNAEFDRRLVREFMDDVVPTPIRMDVSHRGLQSGDYVYRISQSWEGMQEDIRKELNSENAAVYVDKTKANQYLQSLNKENLADNESKMGIIVDAYMFCLYLDRLKKYKK